MLPIHVKDADASRAVDTTPFYNWLTRQNIIGVLHLKLIPALREYRDIPEGRSDIDAAQMFIYRSIFLTFIGDHLRSAHNG